jgi:D-alanyl-lipoteichoic acid acyltransferase DltB (MBOAT superfamily)
MAFVPIYILILAFTIIIDFFAGIFIEKSIGKRRKLFLVFSLIANIGVLALFKYYNFIGDNLSYLLKGVGLNIQLPYLSILLPIGLSFHTFQAMSYTVEVYRGNYRAEKHFGLYSLYVMFYPQLVAGPIERPQNLLSQFRKKFDFDYERVTDGLRLMAWGLFKKVVIADRLALIVDKVFNSPQSHNSFGLIIAIIFFSFQIYCDFSGYSDIAIGAAQVMGFKLMKNFNFPYRAKSVSEFWKRWHISLSSWFKDYLYITLGGNRVSIPRWHLNLFIVFLVSGLWHGANWTFIIWGALHGLYVTSSIFKNKFKKRFLGEAVQSPILSTFTTFILISFAWIFFRADSLQTALYIATNIFSGIPYLLEKDINHESIWGNLGDSQKDLMISCALIILLECIHYLQNKVDINLYFKKLPIYIRWTIYYAAIISIMTMGVFKNRQFIYFQF